jgi:hypothetical protein
VVPGLGGIVEDGGLVRLAAGFENYFLQGHVGKFAARNELVQVVEVTLVVLAVMKADGLGRNDGFQGIVRVGQGREFEGGGPGEAAQASKGEKECGAGSGCQKFSAAQTARWCRKVFVHGCTSDVVTFSDKLREPRMPREAMPSSLPASLPGVNLRETCHCPYRVLSAQGKRD